MANPSPTVTVNLAHLGIEQLRQLRGSLPFDLYSREVKVLNDEIVLREAVDKSCQTNRIEAGIEQPEPVRDLQWLGKKLKETYDKAPRKGQTSFNMMFGIAYSIEILAVGVKEVVQEAGLKKSIYCDLIKGINLAEYVLAEDVRYNHFETT